MSLDRPLVTIRDLDLRAATSRGEAHILKGIDLDIPNGCILGVVGESGSGKSSLANALIRLLPGNITRISGEIRLGDTNLLALDEAGIQALRGTRLAMIFQDPMTALNPLFSVERHLVDVVRRRWPGIAHAEAVRRAEAAIKAVGIADAALRLKSHPSNLSGGMRQRVLIAMALLAEPDLLIADEPTTALDATIEAQIIALLKNLRSRLSGSILFISHHLGLVAQLCERICVMYGGTIVEIGDSRTIMAAPAHPYTRALVACMIDGADAAGDQPLAFIPGEVPDPVKPVDGCIFAPRCAYVVGACREARPDLRDFGATRQAACHRLEEIA